MAATTQPQNTGLRRDAIALREVGLVHLDIEVEPAEAPSPS